MIRTEAILLTKDNASVIASTMDDDMTAEELLAEADHLFNLNGAVVLYTSVFEDGMRMHGGTVHESLYKANYKNFNELNDKTYVNVNNI